MKAMKDFPKVLYQKVLFTAFIGAGCMLVGLAFYLFSQDGMTLALSLALFVFSVLRAFLLYRSVAAGRYEVVEGTCVAVRQRALRKHFTVKIMDDDGIESTLRLGKQSRVKIGTRYRFYFSKAERITLGSEYLDTALSSSGFLGYEALGDIMDTAPAAADETGRADVIEDADATQDMDENTGKP